MSVRLTRKTWHSTMLNLKAQIVKAVESGLDWRMLRVGVSSDNMVFIDLDMTEPYCREKINEILSTIHRIVGADLFVFGTERGYHMIPCAVLFNRSIALSSLEGLKGVEKHKRRRGWTKIVSTKWWERRYGISYPSEYEIDAVVDALNKMTDPRMFWDDAYRAIAYAVPPQCLDYLHVQVSLQRHYTTLRAVPKPGKPMDIQFIGLYDGRAVVRMDLERAIAVAKCTKFDDVELANRITQHVRANYPHARLPQIDALIRFILGV